MSEGKEDSIELKKKYAEIAALKKAIEEQKSGNSGGNPYPTSQIHPQGGYGFAARGRGRGGAFRVYRGGYSGRGAFRGRGGARGGFGNTYRNMSLVVTGDDSASTNSEEGTNTTEGTYITRVSKGGMSIVNAAVHERDQEKIRLLREEQETLKAALKQKRRLHGLKLKLPKRRVETDSCDRVEIAGDKFAVTAHGNRLVPITLPVGTKPKHEKWNGKIYDRKGNGVLKCKGRKARVPKDQCRYFSRTGLCQKGSNCEYQHDKSRIRICRQYLLNKCFNKHCLFSHACNENNTPICKYHLQRGCSNSQCWFQHWKPAHYDDPNYDIWVCRPFSIGGWCERGKKCPFMHLFVCPDFEEDGVCPKGNTCTLTHQITKRTQDLMVTPSNKYIAPTEDGVLVESEDDTENAQKTVIVNSYTVDPELLFASAVINGKYDIYIDNNKKDEGGEASTSTPTFKENSEFLIVDDNSSEESDSENDGLEDNEDYVQF